MTEKSDLTKPLLVYDGDCGFCLRCVALSKRMTREKVDYLSFAEAGARYPHLSSPNAVRLALPDGNVYEGAHAVFRLLDLAGRLRWALRAYESLPWVARLSEFAYHVVARNRTFFSGLWNAWDNLAASSNRGYFIRWLFLRALGVIYLIAFLSLGSQLLGLVGSQGMLPAEDYLKAVKERYADSYVSLLPTIFWKGASDEALQNVSRGGAVLAVLLILDFAPVVTLAALWFLYLSLLGICREFLGFQWDILLLEVGFLAIFFAPARVLPNLLGRRTESSPSLVVGLLFRWLLFRLMFSSGLVKLASGDPAWRGFSALRYHYETQPLPVWTSWYAHHFPPAFHTVSTVLMFVIELVIPFAMFGPRPWRLWACGLTAGLQLLVMATGNYCFFNLLALALCLFLLDDDVFHSIGKKWHVALSKAKTLVFKRDSSARLGRGSPDTTVVSAAAPQNDIIRGIFSFRGGSVSLLPYVLRWPIRSIRVLLAGLILVLSGVQLSAQFLWDRRPPNWAQNFLQKMNPYRIVNTYGLFAVMTVARPEIIIEGSDDGKVWLAYEFKWKPGDEKRAPRFVAPHQPRLDWQMWFAALSNYQSQPWFLNFLTRLLQGSTPVLDLLEKNPFPEKPPRYVRALGYVYGFTDAETRKKEGTWWRRDLKGLYCPVVYLKK